jgi:hypothetical protein
MTTKDWGLKGVSGSSTAATKLASAGRSETSRTFMAGRTLAVAVSSIFSPTATRRRSSVTLTWLSLWFSAEFSS